MDGLRFIAGSGRSGTTWVQDAIAKANDLRPVFEPLNPYASNLGWKYAHRSLKPDGEHSDLKRYLDDVFAGRRVRLWTKYRRQWRWLLPRKEELRFAYRGPNVLNRWARFMGEFPDLAHMASMNAPIVKCIWSNLMLGWLINNYDCRLVFIVRHPGAVIESEFRNKWNCRFAIERFKADPNFHEMTEGRYRALLKKSLSPIEALALRWLVENQWNIENAKRLSLTVVHYEHLSSPTEDAWRIVCDALELRHVPDEVTIRKPSQQSARRESSAERSAERHPRWHSLLSSADKSRIQSILDEGGFSLYAMDSANPRQVSGCAAEALDRKVVT